MAKSNTIPKLDYEYPKSSVPMWYIYKGRAKQLRSMLHDFIADLVSGSIFSLNLIPANQFDKLTPFIVTVPSLGSYYPFLVSEEDASELKNNSDFLPVDDLGLPEEAVNEQQRIIKNVVQYLRRVYPLITYRTHRNISPNVDIAFTFDNCPLDVLLYFGIIIGKRSLGSSKSTGWVCRIRRGTKDYHSKVLIDALPTNFRIMYEKENMESSL